MKPASAETTPVRRKELDGELTIVTAGETGELLKAFVTKGPDLQLGLSGVTDFDTAGLQLLLSARATAEELGTTLTFLQPSPPVASVIAMAHLEDQFQSATHSAAHAAPAVGPESTEA